VGNSQFRLSTLLAITTGVALLLPLTIWFLYPPLRVIRINGSDYRPKRSQVPAHLHNVSFQGLVAYDSSRNSFCARVAKTIKVEKNVLGAIVYGVKVNNVVKENDGQYSWKTANGFCNLRTGTSTIKTLADIDYYRNREIWGAIRKHWKNVDGWRDEVYSICLGDRMYPAAKVPQSAASWSDDPTIVIVRYPAPNNSKGITAGESILRDCAAHIINSAYQRQTRNLKIELHLDLYEPFAVDFPEIGGGYYRIRPPGAQR